MDEREFYMKNSAWRGIGVLRRRQNSGRSGMDIRLGKSQRYCEIESGSIVSMRSSE